MEPKEHREHNGRRAIRNWRVTLQGVCDLLALASRIGSGKAAGQLGGCSHGSSSSMAPVHTPCPSGRPLKSAEQKDGNVVSDKQVYYAQVIKTAPLLTVARNFEADGGGAEEDATGECEGDDQHAQGATLCTMSVSNASSKASSEEGRLHQGSALLEVPGSGVRVFQMGQAGAAGAQGGRDQELGRGDERREGGADCPTGNDTGGRDQLQRGAEGHDRKARARDDGKGRKPSAAATAHAVTTAVPDRDHGRRANQGDYEEHSATSTGHGQSAGAAEADGFCRGTPEGDREQGPVHGVKELSEIRCAPWATRIISGSMRNSWIKMQLEDEDQPRRARRVPGAYWVVENGQARREIGLLAEDEEKEVYGIFAAENLDDLDQEERIGHWERSSGRRSRRR